MLPPPCPCPDSCWLSVLWAQVWSRAGLPLLPVTQHSLPCRSLFPAGTACSPSGELSSGVLFSAVSHGHSQSTRKSGESDRPLPLPPASELLRQQSCLGHLVCQTTSPETLCKYLNGERKELGSIWELAEDFLREKQTCPLERVQRLT